MAWRKHIWFWIIALFVLVLTLPIFTPAHQIWANVVSELKMIESAFGRADTNKLTKAATSIYNSIFVDTGMVSVVEKGRVSESERQTGQDLFGQSIIHVTGLTNNYVTAFSALVYVMTVRLFIILGWLPYLAPFLAAVIMDGLVRRRIRMCEIGAASAVKFSMALHLVIIILIFPVLYMLAPMAVSPLFLPMWALLSAIPLAVLVSNVQQLSVG